MSGRNKTEPESNIECVKEVVGMLPDGGLGSYVEDVEALLTDHDRLTRELEALRSALDHPEKCLSDVVTEQAETIRQANIQIEALRSAVESAPHDDECVITGLRYYRKPVTDADCNCWKAKALTEDKP